MMRFLFSILLALHFIGCGGEDNNSKLPPQISNETEILRSASSKLINSYGLSLKSELMSAINAGGFDNAVSVCEERAPLIAASQVSEGWSINRVSVKNRSTKNLADQHQLQILKNFSDTTLQLTYFDEWITTDTGRSYYYYKPIYVGKLCLKCHGQIKEIAPEVKTVIKEKYPDDKAFGYREGDLRGMFVVKVSAPEGLEQLQSTAGDNP